MKLTPRQVDILERCLLAEKFTRPYAQLKPAITFADIRCLTDFGLVEWRNGFRLTEAGKLELLLAKAGM